MNPKKELLWGHRVKIQKGNATILKQSLSRNPLYARPRLRMALGVDRWLVHVDSEFVLGRHAFNHSIELNVYLLVAIIKTAGVTPDAILNRFAHSVVDIIVETLPITMQQ